MLLLWRNKNILQISVRELQNDMILPISEGNIFGTITVDGKVCIGDTSLSKYMPKYIKPMRNINNIICGC